MANLSTIARPYAEALFAVAKERVGSLDALSSGLEVLAQVAQVPEVREALSDPRLTVDQCAHLFLDVANAQSKTELPVALHNFVSLLLSNNRLLLLPEIQVQFKALCDALSGVSECQIVSAFELSADQVESLVTDLSQKFGTQLKAVVSVDKALIGGVRVTVGDHVLDTSVQAQLQRMQQTLASV